MMYLVAAIFVLGCALVRLPEKPQPTSPPATQAAPAATTTAPGGGR